MFKSKKKFYFLYIEYIYILFLDYLTRYSLP